MTLQELINEGVRLTQRVPQMASKTLRVRTGDSETDATVEFVPGDDGPVLKITPAVHESGESSDKARPEPKVTEGDADRPGGGRKRRGVS